jgi:hypothetical protein
LAILDFSLQVEFSITIDYSSASYIVHPVATPHRKSFGDFMVCEEVLNVINVARTGAMCFIMCII